MPIPTIFDRNKVRAQRNKIAQIEPPCDFILKRAVDEILFRLNGINPNFERCLILGNPALDLVNALKPFGQTNNIYSSDISHQILSKTAGIKIQLDEEHLPFAPNSFDLILAPLTLQFINDLPGCLAQIKKILKQDGLFLGAIIGGQSLGELRTSLLQADLEKYDGAQMRIAPMIDVKTLGALLQRAGFKDPVTDSDQFQVNYKNIKTLFLDLKQMGARGILSSTSQTSPCPPIKKITNHYKNIVSAQQKKTDRMTASFEIIYTYCLK